jgi:hypothetical protein
MASMVPSDSDKTRIVEYILWYAIFGQHRIVGMLYSEYAIFGAGSVRPEQEPSADTRPAGLTRIRHTAGSAGTAGPARIARKDATAGTLPGAAMGVPGRGSGRGGRSI